MAVSLQTGLPTHSAIQQRKTCKVLSQVDLPVREMTSEVERLLKLAGLAPFHRPCDEVYRRANGLDGIEPWRFYAVDAATCRRLKHLIPQENAGKIPAMLSAADVLVMATWLPSPHPEFSATVSQPRFEPNLVNMEHIAAAGAAVQNLLLAATSQGIESYWSSGGVLRSAEVFELLGIDDREILLAAVFLFPREAVGAEVVGRR